MNEKDLYSSYLAALKNDGSGDYSLQMLLLLLLMAGAIFAAVYVVRHYILPFLESRKAKAKAEITLFRIEIILWGLFVIFGLYNLMLYNIWLTVVLLVVIGVIGINFFRDFFPGLLYRLEDKFKEGDLLRLGEFTGQIMSVGIRNIQLKTEDEELILVPYARIANKEIVKLQAKGRLISSRLSYHVLEARRDEVRSRIPDWLRACPWAIVNESVQVTENGDGVLVVTVYAVDQQSVIRIDDYITQKISSLYPA